MTPSKLFFIIVVIGHEYLYRVPLVTAGHLPNVYSLLTDFCPEKDLCSSTLSPDDSHEIPHVTVSKLLHIEDQINVSDNGRPTCCPRCSCDEKHCGQTGNCCPGINQSTADGNDEHTVKCFPLSISTSGFEHMNGNTTDFNISDTNFGVFMVSSCLDGSDDKRCTEPDTNSLQEAIPYTCAKSGITYRNTYCAQCNNAQEETPWHVFVSCSEQNIAKSHLKYATDIVEHIHQDVVQLKKQTCRIEFYPPDDVTVTSNLCYINGSIISSCPDETVNQTLKEACRMAKYDPIVIQNGSIHTAYANVFCSLCATQTVGEPCSRPTTNVQRIDNTFIAELNTEDVQTSKVFPSWTSSDVSLNSGHAQENQCYNNTFFDPYMKSCHTWYCPNRRYYHNSDCLPVYTDMKKATFRVDLTLTIDIQTGTESLTDNQTDIARKVIDTMYGNAADIEKDIVVLASSSDERSVKMFAIVLLRVVRSSDNVKLLFDQTTYGHDILVSGTSGTAVSVSVDFSVGVKVTAGMPPITKVAVVNMLDFNTVSLISSYPGDVVAALNSPMINKLSFCRKIRLADTSIRDYIDMIDIRLSSVLLYIGEFQRTGIRYEIEVCLSDYLRNVPKHFKVRSERNYTPQIILSVVCSILSITGLILTILTYIVFDELRSIPGKNNMMLALHLLIAQCLYQFGMGETNDKLMCEVIGILIHMFWLIAIFWMNACTLHMFRTFVTGQSYRSVRAFDPQVCCYGLYCYSISICMVVINVAVSMYTSNGEDIGYGGTICYISKPVMVGWLFALPVGVVIILNMGFFFAVVYQISASTMRRHGKTTDRANTLIYMKLSSLTGVTWIFGFLYLWTNFVPFEYMFIVLNAGQGVMIFISFICTNRIMKMYMNAFRKFGRSTRCLCVHKGNSAASENAQKEGVTAKMSLTPGSSTKSVLPGFLQNLQISMPKRRPLKTPVAKPAAHCPDETTKSKSKRSKKPQSLRIVIKNSTHHAAANNVMETQREAAGEHIPDDHGQP